MKKIQQGFFITGTDTGVGKTEVSLGLLLLLKKHGFSTVALKPIATGCIETPEGLRNNDAQLLQKNITKQLSYSDINPISFFEPIAPHIAAKLVNQPLSVKEIIAACNNTLSVSADFIIIEGTGGWLVPLNAEETMADVAIQFNYPLIIVVGIRLGCLNHALLTVSHIKTTSIPIAGWVANVITPEMPSLFENIQALTERIPAPLLGIIPYQKKVEPYSISHYLESELLSLLKTHHCHAVEPEYPL